MPYKCSVPKCRGNYTNGPKVTCFQFPNDPVLKENWLRAIKRDSYTPTASSRVCELHFQEDFIQRKTSYTVESTGEVLECALKIPRLVEGAVPTKLAGCSSYLSKPDVPLRDSPSTKRLRKEYLDIEKAIAESLETSDAHAESIAFSTVDEALKKMETHLEEGWLKAKGKQYACFFYLPELFLEKLSTEGSGRKITVFLCENLEVNVFFGDIKIKKIVCRDKSMFTFPLCVSDITCLSKVLCESKFYLIDNMNNQKNKHQTLKEELDLASTILDSASQNCPEKKQSIDFLLEQLKLLPFSYNRLRYPFETLLFACLLHSISPHAYKFLRSSNKLTLPSPRTIQTVCASFNTNPRLEQNEENFLKYVSNKFPLLTDSDKTVVLMVDEIHLKPNFDYKSGNVVGGAFNDATERATSAHVFMINSLLSPYKEVAHILPVHTLSGEELHKLIKKVIVGLEKLGFEVIAVVTDNNSINKKAMSFFSEQRAILNEYPHPCNSDRPLFFVIDPVHILKNIRNNWINQKPDQQLEYPDFDDHNIWKIASFSALKELHMREKNQLLKYGYTLSLKALYPSSIERQNVRLALQVLNHNIVAALEQIGPKISLTNYEDTACFIKIICKWWDIVNVKSPLKGQRLLNKFQEPVTKNSEHLFNYLNSFVEWLDAWKIGNKSYGKFTRETHDALRQTTSALIKISNYCLHKKNYNYILLGKIQTDKLEERFGKYRYHAGAQYHVYIRQVFEIESKLRIQNVIPLIIKSKKFGDIAITKEDISTFIDDGTQDDGLDSVIIPENLRECGVVSDEDISSISEREWAPLVYVAGYSTYAVAKKIKCDYCKNFTTANESTTDIDFSLVTAVSRGGLCYPSEDVVQIASFAYIVVQKLLKNEDNFLKEKNHRMILQTLCFNAITSGLEDSFMGHNGTCHSQEELTCLILKPMSNILLKNYVKKKNDTTTGKSMPEVKRLKKY